MALVFWGPAAWGLGNACLNFDYDQQPYQPTSGRVALVIGNADYAGRSSLFGSLPNPVNDASAMAHKLCRFGFHVALGENLDWRGMDALAAEFLGYIKPGDQALFYFSGHGVAVESRNYLIPVGRSFRTGNDVKYSAFNAHAFLEDLSASPARVRIMILDSCREHLCPGRRQKRPGNLAVGCGRGGAPSFLMPPSKAGWPMTIWRGI